MLTNGARLVSAARRFKGEDVTIVESVLRGFKSEVNTGQNRISWILHCFPFPFLRVNAVVAIRISL